MLRSHIRRGSAKDRTSPGTEANALSARHNVCSPWLPTMLGIVFLLAAFLCNEWVYREVFTNHGTIYGATRVKIWLCSVIAYGVAVVLLVLRRQLNRQSIRACAVQWPEALAILLGVGIAAALFFGVEAAFFAVNTIRKGPSPVDRLRNTHFYRMDPFLGRASPPNKRLAEVALHDGEVIFEAIYTIDGYGRRVVPGRPDQPEAPQNKFILCFGGSFTFGTGVQDDETWPYYLSLGAPEHQVYNYGYGGYGPHHMLRRMERPEFASGIGQSQGILVYLFLPSHVQRLAGSMHLLTTWGRHAPCYQLDNRGKLAGGELFPDARPFLVAWYDLLSHEQVLQFFRADFPPPYQPDDLELVAEVLRTAAERLRRLHWNNETYVVLYPVPKQKLPQTMACRQAFEKAGLHVLDYTDLFDRMSPDYQYQYELHPKPKAYRAVAARLLEDLPLHD